MQSHLDGGGRPRRGHRNVFSAEEIDHAVGGGGGAMSRTPHGDVVDPRFIEDHVGGSRGILEGAPQDARKRMHTTAGLPQEAANWRGSDTHYLERELPVNDHEGLGFWGSAEQYSLEELDQIDAQNATGQRTAGAPTQPGAYLQPDGNVLLINHDGQQAVVTQGQYNELMQRHAQAQQQAGDSLGGRLLSALKGRRHG